MNPVEIMSFLVRENRRHRTKVTAVLADPEVEASAKPVECN